MWRKAPFLSEGLVKEARVYDNVGGFAIRVEFERRGTWLLEQYTASNQANASLFTENFLIHRVQDECDPLVGGPIITRRIGDGVLIFTPDASRDESSCSCWAQQLARKNDDELKW
jgi:hypothetical protein